MYQVELYGRVRRACFVEGMSRREAARVFGLHRDTVRKMLKYSVPPGYRREQPPHRPKLDPHSIALGTLRAGEATGSLLGLLLRAFESINRHTTLGSFRLIWLSLRSMARWKLQIPGVIEPLHQAGIVEHDIA